MNPLARKRWNRFRRHRRGFASLCLLVTLYVISLFAEFISNDRPLYVRYEGRSFFPALRFYPDDTFTGSGRMTRPDYKTIAASEVFRANPANRMVFAPFPYGPYEIIKPETLRDEERVELLLRAAPRVGNVNIDPSFRVTRSQSAAFFLEGAPEDALDRAWIFPAEWRAGVTTRFANQPAPALRVILTNALDPERVAEVAMTAFQPRSQPPRDVRITFREAGGAETVTHRLVFRPGPEIVEPIPPLWTHLDDPARATLGHLAAQTLDGLSLAPPFTLNGVEYTPTLRRNDVRWPFRPAGRHWLGIDNAGRDVFARILYGLRTSMTFGLLLVVFSMAFGTAMGALQGYYGGKVDLVGQRLIEVWSTIPFLYVMILLGSMYGRSFSLLLFCYGIFNWIGISYYVRAEFLRLRATPFVDAARCLGLSSSRIMFRHILPNALTPIITFFPFSLVGAIGSLAVLDYLGFGLPPPTPSWGELLQQAQAFRWAWWLILYPSLALFVVMLLGVFMGEGVRDAYDPKPVMRME